MHRSEKVGVLTIAGFRWLGLTPCELCGRLEHQISLINLLDLSSWRQAKLIIKIKKDSEVKRLV